MAKRLNVWTWPLKMNSIIWKQTSNFENSNLVTSSSTRSLMERNEKTSEKHRILNIKFQSCHIKRNTYNPIFLTHAQTSIT